MKPHPLAVGFIALISTLAGHAATAPLRAQRIALAAAPGVHLQAFGARGTQGAIGNSAKLDSTLADLLQHVALARPGHLLPDLHSLSPAAHFMMRVPTTQPYVLIDAVTRGDPQHLKSALVGLGLQNAAVFSNDVGGWLPVNQIAAAAARSELHSMRASMSRTRTGAVTSQGDFVIGSAALRTTYPTLDGTGITVGVLSDSFDCYPVYAQNNVPASGNAGYAPNGFTTTATQDMTSGDLPMSVNVLKDADCMNYGAPIFLPFGDEGRAMLQIVHDVAPGAALAFYTAENSEADFANGIVALANAGAQVVADDVGYFDEPFYQDGLLAQAVDQVEAQGAVYVSAAGNNGNLSYENTAPSFATLSSTAPNSGEYLLNFDTSGATTTTSLPVTVPALFPGEFIALVLEWDQPYVTGAAGSPGASSHMDLCVTGSGTDTITDLNGHSVACTGPNATGSDALQVLIISNPANAAGNTATEHLSIMVGVANGTTPPGRIKLIVEDDGAGSTIDQFDTASPTLQGHAGAAGAVTVGAADFLRTPACGVNPAVIEPYSALGGTPILFDKSGTALPTPMVRQKPDVVGPDGVNDTFLGDDQLADVANSSIPQCVSVYSDPPTNQKPFPRFFGTSAATPHVAAVAALLLQSNSAVTTTQVQSALRMSALPMGGSSPNFNSGYGLIQAQAALAQVPPPAPHLMIGPVNVTPGANTTLTWSSLNTTACTASGTWSGPQATQGAAGVVAPAALGTYTYTLTCSNAAGSSQPTSVTLNVVANTGGGGGGGGSGPPAGHGGGGAIDELTLLALSALALAQIARTRLPVRRRARSLQKR